MVKKISALFLALVLCLSVMVVPVSALELGDAKIAFELKWDKEYYSAGDTAVLSVYMDAEDSLSLASGAITIGFNSAVINMADNPIETVKENSTTDATFASFFKKASVNTAWFTTATLMSKLQTANTAEENEKFDTYLKFLVAKDSSGGSHANTGVNNAGFGGDEFDPTVPIVTYTLVISASAPNGTPVEAKITTGTYSVTPVAQSQTSFKYYSNPGVTTTAANVTAANFSSTAATPATVGVEPCEEHTWDSGVEKTAATCGEAGEMLYTCSVCSSTKTEEIPATGKHTAGDPVDENVVPASCNAAGSKDVVVYCTVCKAEVSRQTGVEIPATGEHNYATKVVKAEATCTEPGSYVMVCGCGAEDTPVTIDALGHDFSEVDAEAVAPTCTVDGSEVLMGCSRCDATEGGAVITATGHNMVAGDVVAPTCTVDGYTVYTCSNGCGTTENKDVVTAPGHDYNEVVTPPTCTEVGYTTYTCDCGETYTADEVAALGHDYEEDFVKKATCSKEGYIRYKCTVCKETYTVDIPSKNHTNEDGSSALVEIPAVAPTCKNVGYTAGTKCTICNSTVDAPQAIPATGHSKDNAVVTEPTYSSQGYTTYTCGTCGVVFKDDYVPAISVEFTFEIAEPSIKTLRARDSLVLHPVFTGEVADGVTVVWTADNNKFKTKTLDDGSLEINSRKNGTTVFTATVYDAEGNEITSDTVEIVSNAKFFQQFLGFFRAIFGTAKYYEN